MKDGVVDANHLFVGRHQEISEKANQKLIEVCREVFSNFDTYTPDDIEAILEDGYAEFGHGSVCISWPEEDVQVLSRAEILLDQIKKSGYIYQKGAMPCIIEDFNLIELALTTNCSSYWNAGDVIDGTDAVILELSNSGYWSVCHKDDFSRMKEFLEIMLTRKGDSE